LPSGAWFLTHVPLSHSASAAQALPLATCRSAGRAPVHVCTTRRRISARTARPAPSFRTMKRSSLPQPSGANTSVLVRPQWVAATGDSKSTTPSAFQSTWIFVCEATSTSATAENSMHGAPSLVSWEICVGASTSSTP
jgi:hypothetical protein